MGLLDEAIREHLDLKRRRGADPTEIERAEREALGPVRRHRDPAVAEALVADTGEAELVGSAYDEPDDPVAGDIAEAPPLDLAVELPPDNEEPPGEESDAPPDDDAPATRVMRAADVPTPSDMTAEFDVEQALAAEAGEGTPADDGEEDVLEETPEFLQDTPDHDRLWFEQRPPRDFDFDG